MSVFKFGLTKLPERVQASVRLKSSFGLKKLAVVEIYDILLEWQDNSDDETGFAIEHSLDGVTWAELTTVSPDTTSYLVTIEVNGVDSSLRNYFRVRAYNDAGDSGFTNEVLI